MCHWFRACVCSGHIPHHKCCSVYVTRGVQIAFHITLHTTLNVFTHIIPSLTSHHLSRHCIPHHTIPRHTTIAQHFTSHYCIPHVPRHISQTFSVAKHPTSNHHILHLTSHYTTVCLPPPSFHTTTSQSTTYSTSHMQPQSTSHAIPHPQLVHTTHKFNIGAHHTTTSWFLHHTTTSDNTLHHFPHLTSQHSAYSTFFTTISHHHISRNIVTFHILHNIPGHHIPRTPWYCTYFTFQTHSTSHHVWRKSATLHITPHFIYTSQFTSHQNSYRSTTSRFTIPDHVHISPRTTPCTPHSNINYASHYPHSTHSTLHFQPFHTLSNVASNHSTSLGIPQSFTSCITAHHRIPRAQPHHSTSHHHISQHI